LHGSAFARTLFRQHSMSADNDLSLSSAARRHPALTAGAGTALLIALLAAAAGWLLRDQELGTQLGLIAASSALIALAAGGAWLVGGAKIRLQDAFETRQRARQNQPVATQAPSLLSGQGQDVDLLIQGESRRLATIATWAQAALALPLAALAGAAVVVLHPLPAGNNAGEFAVGVACIIFGFPLLVLERRLQATEPQRFREGRHLARLLRLGVWTLVAGGAAAVCRAYDLEAAAYVQWALAGFIGLVAIELALRAIAAPFLPIAKPSEATGLGDATLTALVLSRGGATGFGSGLKERFGIDLSQSWAVRFLRRAALPLGALLLLIGWLLTALTTLSPGERGVYERCGAPIAVLQPGLHAHLPWPFGRVLRVEYGQVHEMPLGGTPDSVAEATPAPDAETPASFDRLWDRKHATDASYLVPGAVASGGSGVGYQLLNADVRVLWRVGMNDQAAQSHAYRVADPAELVRSQALRLLQRGFATRPLTSFIGDDRDTLSEHLRRELQQELDTLQAGLDVTALVVDAIHPPMDAVPAYHGVQAAEIGATTDIARAKGQAAGTLNDAQREAVGRLAQGQANASVTVSDARAKTTRDTADLAAFALAPDAMRLERWLQTLSRSLSKANLTIVDHRLALDGGPTIDLRKPGNE
jgi:regulator of protease activity HflC (stomatin/prohibitin superfamily)